MTTLPTPASPVHTTTGGLPSQVEIHGRKYRVILLPGRMFDGSGMEKHFIVDHQIGVLRLSGAIPAGDRRFVLARTLVYLNS